jgi:hypothetical protein
MQNGQNKKKNMKKQVEKKDNKQMLFLGICLLGNHVDLVN